MHVILEVIRGETGPLSGGIKDTSWEKGATIRQRARHRRLLSNLFTRSPEIFRHRVNIWRARKSWKTAGVLFIHVPKVAGFSLSRSLYGHVYGHMTALEVEANAADLFAELPVFAVVRNPWDRVVSAYHFAIAGGVGAMRVAQPAQYRQPAFRTFDAFLEEWLPAQNLMKCDYIFQPQYRFVCRPTGELAVDFLGRMEDMQSTYDFLAEITGRNLEVKRENTSNREADYRGYYTHPRLKNLVADAYAEDVRLFGYDF